MQKKAFTLVELMVAVTIMGILALIAVPQANYRIARARCAEAALAIKTYERMQSGYYTAMGEVGSLQDLGLTMPSSGWFSYNIDVGTAVNESALQVSGGMEVAKSEKKSDTETGNQGKGTEKVDLCHVPPGNPAAAHVINVGSPAYDTDLAHGDAPAPCPETEASEYGYEAPSVLLVATVLQKIAYDCREGDAIFSEWTPLEISRGDANSGSCTRYMGKAFQQ